MLKSNRTLNKLQCFLAEGIRHGKVPKKLFRAVVAAGSGEAVRTSPSRLPFFPAALTSQLTGCDSLLLLRHEKRSARRSFFRGGEGGIRTLEPFYRLHDFQKRATAEACRKALFLCSPRAALDKNRLKGRQTCKRLHASGRLFPTPAGVFSRSCQ